MSDSKNSSNWVGVVVICGTCGDQKAPHGRSASGLRQYCQPLWQDEGCAGYYDDPKPGCLWPGETSEDFGYPHCENGARLAT